MTDTAIRVQNLSKRYRIGREEDVPDTLAGALASFAKSPLRNLRRLRRLTRFGQDGHNPDHSPDDVIWALKDVSFEVERGEVVGIIGRNGAGKSTLLKILSRITHPTSGRVELRGRVSSLLEVGTGFHPELTGRENVYLNGTVLGMSKAEVDRKFDEIVAFSGVEKFIDTPVKRYSSGMKVRLAFAVAAHLEPEILLVDEVLAVGDVAFQKKCLGKMEDVSRIGKTVCFVSHNMGFISKLCDRCLLIQAGTLAFDGETTVTVAKYLSNRPNESSELPIGDERFMLNSAFLAPNRAIQTNESISIHMGFSIRKKSKGLRIGFDLMTESGTLLFRSFHDDLAKEISHLRPGNYCLVGTIPADLLKPGRYFISIEVGVHNVEMIIADSILLPFNVILTDGVNHLYGGHKDGVIMPAVQWKLDSQKL